MTSTIGRRGLIGGLAGSLAVPFVGRAQQPGMPVVGFLFSGAPERNEDYVAAFRRGMGETGFEVGRNVQVHYRWTYSDPDRTSGLVADLVNSGVAVIAASTAAMALRAKAATATIPIVFVAFADAVQVGLVTNLARPDSNVTGINAMSAELGAKRLGLLHTLLPRAVRFGLLVNPIVPAVEADIASTQAAAKAMGLSLETLTASTSNEIDAAFARAVEQRIDALTIDRSQFFSDRRVQLTTLSVRHALPAIFFERSFPEVGGLISYDSSRTELFRQAGIYVGRILKGAKPADLPVIQPTRFELVINMQTARLLGIEVPPALRAVADEVIE